MPHYFEKPYAQHKNTYNTKMIYFLWYKHIQHKANILKLRQDIMDLAS